MKDNLPEWEGNPPLILTFLHCIIFIINIDVLRIFLIVFILLVKDLIQTAAEWCKSSEAGSEMIIDFLSPK